VIAIIAILAAVLVPVFMAAKASAKKAGCLSDERQIAYGFRMYTADYNDCYPNQDCGAHLYLIERYLRQRKVKVSDEKSATSIWLCPAAPKDQYYTCQGFHWLPGPPPWGPIGSTIRVFNSYAVNADVTWDGYGRVSDVRRQTRFVLIAEGCRDPGGLGSAPSAVHPHENRSTDVIGWCKHVVRGSISEIHPQHGRGANFLFVDLHIAFSTQVPPLDQWKLDR